MRILAWCIGCDGVRRMTLIPVKEDNEKPTTDSDPRYVATGVNVDDNTALIPAIRDIARSTRVNPALGRVVGDIGACSGQFQVQGKAPVLAASTDSVGTKVLIARMAGRYDTVGRDLVNHCVNDILTSGARPLFFLDYLASNRLSLPVKKQIVSGLAAACAKNEVALIGGETADLPDVYQSGVFDIAGTIVGIVTSGEPVNGSGIEQGDVLVGLPSNGLHTNGYSLVRRVFDLKSDPAHDDENLEKLKQYYPALNGRLGDELLRVHRSYLADVLPVLDRCKGIAHITGGGAAENIERVLPPRCGAIVDCSSWQTPPIFRLIQQEGKVTVDEMYRVFNMGLGMVLVIARENRDDVLRQVRDAWEVGRVVPRAHVRDEDFHVRLDSMS